MSDARASGRCPLCDAGAPRFATKRGGWRPLAYELARCEHCGFAFVVNPSTDFEAIYDEAYYRGRGADPLVDYIGELERPNTIRRLEWEGIADSVARLLPLDGRLRWLDYGCGMGGLVDYLGRVRGVAAVGFDTGMPSLYAAHARGARIDRAALEAQSGSYDVVSAIEVLEHVFDPIAVLSEIERLLRPGGIFFYTTGNAAKFRDRFVEWGYVRPEIHVSYYEPRTLRYAFERVGLTPFNVPMNAGARKILTFKILKELRRDEVEPWMRVIPWPLVTRVVDARYGFTEMPLARKQGSEGT